MLVDFFQQRYGIHKGDGFPENDEVVLAVGLQFVIRTHHCQRVPCAAVFHDDQLVLAVLFGFELVGAVEQVKRAGFADAGDAFEVLEPGAPRAVGGAEEASGERGFRPDHPVRPAQGDGAFIAIAHCLLEPLGIRIGEGFQRLDGFLFIGDVHFVRLPQHPGGILRDVDLHQQRLESHGFTAALHSHACDAITKNQPDDRHSCHKIQPRPPRSVTRAHQHAPTGLHKHRLEKYQQQGKPGNP